MSDIKRPRTFLLQAFSILWMGTVASAGFLVGIAIGLPKLLIFLVIIVLAIPAFITYSIARRRQQRYYQLLIDETLAGVREDSPIGPRSPAEKLIL